MDPRLPDPTARFTDRVADYVDARPRYPDALVDLLLSLGLPGDAVIADIGAGTGLSAEPFLRRGHRVHCVEPNAAMRAAAESVLGSFAGFRSVDGTAESTGLGDGSVDAVVAAQAFHWFEPDPARREAVRILKPGGRVALVWNTRRADGDAFLRGYEALLRRFGTDYDRIRERTERATTPAVLDRFFHGGYERHVLENRQVLDLDGLRKRVRSASYVPAPDSPGHGPMMEALTSLFEEVARDGRVRILYDLDVFWGAPRPPGSYAAGVARSAARRYRESGAESTAERDGDR